MLKSLELENFKAFGARAVIPLAPITLIFGQNSSGKSSILHSLNLLKQTRESSEPGAILLPKTSHGTVDLGSFQAMVFDHDLKQSICIQPEVDLSFPLNPLLRISRKLHGVGIPSIALEITAHRPTTKQDISLSRLRLFTSGWDSPLAVFEPSKEDNPKQAERMAWRYRHIRRDHAKLQLLRCVDVTRDERLWGPSFEWSKKHLKDILENLDARESRSRFGPWQEDLWGEEESAGDSDLKNRRDKRANEAKQAKEFYAKSYGLGDFISRICRYQTNLRLAVDGFIPVSHDGGEPPELHRLYFIPPRFEPIFFSVGQLSRVAGECLDLSMKQLLPLGPSRISPERWYMFTGTSPSDVGYHGERLPDLLYRNPELVKDLNQWLDRLDIGYHAEVKASQDNPDLFEVRLLDRRRHPAVQVALPDVGYGLSQILPFIVQSLASSGRIISIEQPEVHVHPRLQADLGDLLAEAIKAPRRNQFIIETHSEHLILRIQKLVRQGKLKAEQVSVLFVSRERDGAKVVRLKMDDKGSFMNEWPGGYFEERLREL